MTFKLTCGRNSEELNTEEKVIIDRITQEYEDKILKHIGKIDDFEVHLKCHTKEGKTKRYTLKIKLVAGKFRLESEADEWNLTNALHIALKKIMSEIEHKVEKARK